MGGEELRVSIEYPHFKLDLQSGDARALAEVRRIVEALSDNQIEPLEDGSLYELRARLSEEFFSHPDLLARVKNSLVMEEDIRITKRVIPFECEYDLEAGREKRQVSVVNVKSIASQLFEGIELQKVRECLVHIRGEIPREQQCVIMDAIKQRLGMGTGIRFFSTTKNLEGNVLVEAVCFGEGIAPEVEW